MMPGAGGGGGGTSYPGDPSERHLQRRTELVLIGQGLDKAKVRQFLEDCLLTDAEVVELDLLGLGGCGAGDGWSALPDPFGLPGIGPFTQAKFLESIGRSGEALQMFQEVLTARRATLGADLSAHVELGSALGRLGDSASATEAFRATLRLDPRHADAYYGLAIGLFSLGRIVEARDAFRKVAALAPGNMEAQQACKDLDAMIKAQAGNGAGEGGGGAAAGGAAEGSSAPVQPKKGGKQKRGGKKKRAGRR